MNTGQQRKDMKEKLCKCGHPERYHGVRTPYAVYGKACIRDTCSCKKFQEKIMFYVDCFTSLWSQHPVVINRETGRIVAKRFKGKFYEDAEKRAKILAEILNRRK